MSSPRVACVIMQRNETDLIEPWLAYHAALFGAENLFVLDNGSTHPKVKATLREFASAGVSVDYTPADPHDFENKGQLIAERIRSIDAAEKYDFYFPLDCDEFVVLWGDRRGLSCRREAILDLLASLKGTSCVLNHDDMLYNVPGCLDLFTHVGSQKVFFAGGQVAWLDNGYHQGGVAGGESRRVSTITYLHFHNKPFEKLLYHAKDKLKCRVDTSDLEAVRRYRGHGDHLVPYFSLTEAAYLDSFSDCKTLLFREFRNVMTALRAEEGIKRVCEAKTAMRPRALPLGPAFDASSYLAANPDVARAGVPPLLHYWKHGLREGRRLAPAATNA